MQTNEDSTIAGEEWMIGGPRGANDKPLWTDALIAQANRDIERHRKSSVELTLLKPDGAPLANTAVKIEQIGHRFEFGSPLASDFYLERTPDEKNISHLFRNLFTTGTALCYWNENWHHPIERFAGQRDLTHFLSAVDYIAKHGMSVKGHTLIFTALKCFPEWLKAYSLEDRMKFLEFHVRNMIQAGEGRVGCWDLINECLWEPSFRNLYSRNWPHIEAIDELLSFIEPAFRWARAEDSRARYVINDYGLEDHNMPFPASKQRTRMIELVRECQNRGVAPDAIGTQCHIGGWHSLDHVRDVLDELSEAGVPIQITEFWAMERECPVKNLDVDKLEALQADYVERFYTVCFAHPRVEHISYWTSDHLFRDDKRSHHVRTPKPMYHRLHELIHDRWTTRLELTTDANGTVRFTGFHGRYLLQADAPHRLRTHLSLDPGGEDRAVRKMA